MSSELLVSEPPAGADAVVWRTAQYYEQLDEANETLLYAPTTLFPWSQTAGERALCYYMLALETVPAPES